jgi:alpha,alpha-trehalase
MPIRLKRLNSSGERRAGILLASALLAGTLWAQAPASVRRSPSILDYIRRTWTVLTRSNKDLATAAVDPKFQPAPDGRWPVYIPPRENLLRVEEAVRKSISPAAFQKIAIRNMPENLRVTGQPGLLYLPKPYVVPGGRFNEMYGWDSFFIQLGLLRDGEIELARDMADNFLYEIENYGKILNANRTYYLTRSQPPFLTQMVLGVYGKTHDRKWLAAALPEIEKYHSFWIREPHLTAETGLSRYFDIGEGPAPESVSDERDAQGRTHYDLVKQYFRTHAINDYDVSQYYDRKADRLTPLFYKGDRSMRESGVDPSNRFGQFNVDVIHYDPVCLNSLLYMMEMQTAEILRILGREPEAAAARKQAADRAARVNRYLWDEKDGLYYDYNFSVKRVRRYPFLSTFYPLWAGLASKEQAARVERNLSKFERAYGLQTSTYVSGSQWDAPFGWAPLELIALDGLRRYGYGEDAERITVKFLSLVRREFLRQGFIVEKYDVVKGGSNVAASIHFGYSANQAGFGWTNAAFTTLLDELTPENRRKVLGESQVAGKAHRILAAPGM